MSDHARVVRTFAIDCVEVMDQLDHDLAALEKEPGNQECLGRIAEVVEFIRTDATRLSLLKLQAITNAGARLLRKLQSGISTCNPTIHTALLAMVDAMRQLLGDIEQLGREGDGDFTGLVDILMKLQEPSAGDGFLPRKKPDSARRKQSGQNPRGVSLEAESLPSIEISEILSPKSRILTPNEISADSPRYQPLPGRLGGSLVRRGHIRSEDLILALREQEAGDRRRVGEILVGLGLLTEDSLQGALRGMSQIVTPSVLAPNADNATVAVRSHLLDQIPQALDDLGHALRQLSEWTSRHSDSEGRRLAYATHQAFGVVQQRIQQTRLQSLDILAPALQRGVADAMTVAGKKGALACFGTAAEVDQAIVQAIQEPLLVLVRHLVERVIEAPETRVAAGKPADAALEMRFEQTAKEARISFQTDRYAELDIAPLRTAVEQHRGSASIARTDAGELRLSIAVPLPAAWVASLILESAGEKFAVRQDDVHEMVRLGSDLSSSAIERVKGSPYLRHRQAAIPLVDLRRVLRSDVLTPFHTPLNVVVLRTRDRHFGLLVDRIDRLETLLVDRRVERRNDADIFAGTSFLHDGSNALLLDTDRLGRHGGALPAALIPEPAKPESPQKPACYLMEAGERRRFAIPLEPADRMESISAEAIQFADGEETLLIDGDIVPLVRISLLLGIVKPATSDMLEVVFRDRRHAAVLLDVQGEVSRTPLQIKRPAKTIGIKGSAIVQDRVIDIIDLDALLDRNLHAPATA